MKKKEREEIKDLLKAVKEKRPFDVKKITDKILARKINDLLEQKKKEIRLGE